MKLAIWFAFSSIALADVSELKQGLSELLAEVDVQAEFEGRLEFDTKSPDYFFRELTVVHAAVAKGIGRDPLAGLIGYGFEKIGEDFEISRIEREHNILGIEVAGLAENEQVATVHQVGVALDGFKIVNTRWLVIPQGQLPNVLTKASRVVEITNEKMKVSDLITSTNGGNLEESGRNQTEPENNRNGLLWIVVSLLAVGSFTLILKIWRSKVARRS